MTPGRHMRGAVVVRCPVGPTPFAVAGSHLGIDVNETPGGRVWRTLTDTGLVDVALPVG